MTDERDESQPWGEMAVVLVAALFAALLVALSGARAQRLTVAMDAALERLDEVVLPSSPLRSALLTARSFWLGLMPLLLRLSR